MLSNWFTLVVIGGAIGVFSLALAWGISRNLKDGQAFRRQLAARLEQLRLHRLMGLLGLDSDRYLSRESIVDVERHMRACAQCDATRQCDSALAEKNPVAVAGFCTNYRDLQNLRHSADD